MNHRFPKLLLSLFLVLWVGEGCVSPSEDLDSDVQWLRQQQKQLAAIEDVTSVEKVEVQTSDDKSSDGYSWLYQGEGRIVFPDKSWVILVSKTYYNGEGNLSLIRASDGKYYFNSGHVCGALILGTRDAVISLDAFLKTRGTQNGTDFTITWKPYTSEQTAAGDGDDAAPEP